MMTNLRLLFVLGLSSTFACSSTPADPGDDQPSVDAAVTPGEDLAPPAAGKGFQIKSPDITIKAGEEVTYCWYFKTPNTDVATIKRWQSRMTKGSHHMIMYTSTSQNAQHPPGSAPTTESCGVGGGISGVPIWTYSAQNEDQDLPMPTDDGAGKPVGMDIAAGQYAYFQMHYNNKGDTDLQAHVTLNAETYDPGTVTTKTAAYVSYNGDLNIPPNVGTETSTATQTCAVPSTSKFWTLSTHAHKRSTHTEVKDGAAMMFSSNDWEHPGAAAWNPTFNSFASGQLTYSCTYHNETNAAIKDGDSADKNEMCMAVGYFFPAAKPTICYSGTVIPF